MQPAEDVIHDRLGEADIRIAAPAAGLEARVRELLAEQLQRNSVLQRDRNRESEAVHQPADRRTFLGHGDEQLAGRAVRIKTDGEISFVASNIELMRNRGALFGQLVPYRLRRTVQIFFFNVRRGGSNARIVFARVRSLGARSRKRLRLLASIAIDRDRLQAQASMPGDTLP